MVAPLATKGCKLRAAPSVSPILTANRMTSAAAMSRGSATTTTGLRLRLPSSLSRRRPLRRITSRWGPRATNVTSLPAAAKRAPKYPPTPPDPITVICIGASSGGDHGATEDLAGGQVVQRRACIGERTHLDRDRRHLAGFDEVQHFARFGRGTHVAAHDGERTQRQHRYGQGEAPTDQTDPDPRTAFCDGRKGEGKGHTGPREVAR